MLLSRFIKCTTALAIAALYVTGCGGTAQFADTSAISIKGTPPAPPPPPPPPAKPKRVEVTQDHIVIKEKIQFELDKATIKHESDSLLQELAEVFNDNPQIKKVSIEGHTDDSGADKYNQGLSERRAKAVLDHLVKLGVDKARLVHKGHGEAKPLIDKTDSESRAANRRVEFLIVEQDTVTKTFVVDPKTGEKREVNEPAKEGK